MIAQLPRQAAAFLFLFICTTVIAQEPFISYNKTVPIGASGYVKWDLNSFAGPVNLWLQQLAPNASAPQVPLDYSNTKGFFLWAAGTNLKPGQYFYQLQIVGGDGIIFKSNPLMVVCSECSADSADEEVASAETDTNGQMSLPADSSGNGSVDSGIQLSPGAAAGIGAGGSLALVAILLAIFLIIRKRRKRKDDWGLKRPSMTTSSHPPSFLMTSPSSQPSSSYEPSPSGRRSFVGRPPVRLISSGDGPRSPSYELDGTAPGTGPITSTDHLRPNSSSQRAVSWQSSGNTIAAELSQSPWSTVSKDASQYRHFSHARSSPPSSSTKSPASNQERRSYGFPSQRSSPNIERNGFSFPSKTPADADSSER